MRIAVLDDYQGVATGLADWPATGAEILVLTEHVADRAELAARLAGCQVVVAMRERTRFDAELLDLLPDLELLVTTGERNAAIDLKATAARGITVCGTGYVNEPTSEHTWALILAAARHLPTEFANMAGGGWQTTVGIGLAGRTLGLLGLGRLGSRVARIGQAFGMRTIAWSQNLTAERAAEHGVTAVTREDLFAESDVLSVHLILSRRTKELVGADDLARMRPGALLVNTSRAAILQQAPLRAAVESGRITAAIDVYDTEPLPADHWLRTVPHAVVTPHLGYVTDQQYEIFYRDAVQDVLAYQAGHPLRLIELPR